MESSSVTLIFEVVEIGFKRRGFDLGRFNLPRSWDCDSAFAAALMSEAFDSVSRFFSLL